MHFSGIANGQKAAKHLLFANQKQQKDRTVHIERGDSSLILYILYI